MQKVTLSNKVFTENPLLDEIVYNARQIATGVIVKDYDKANNAETLESTMNGDVLIAIKQGTIQFNNFKYDKEILGMYYTDPKVINAYYIDNELIPNSDRPALLNIAVNLFNNNFVETNNYYRMLHGDPNYDETGVWEGLWIDVNYIDDTIPTSIDHISNFYKEEYLYDNNGNIIYDSYGLPIVVSDYRLIHELNLSYQNIIYDNGTCENIINDSSTLASWDLTKDDVMYVMYIGDRSVDYYNARVAEKFGLLYCPECDSKEVQRRFKDLYEANRRYLLYTIYSEAYKYRSDYYDNFMMIFLVIQTIIDMIIELPEYIIRRDIFDTRTCKYIFESNGVKYFKDIPLKYQVALVKNLNKLIKFKSTDKCIVNIISLFGTENIEVFRYYILKDRTVDNIKTLNYYNNQKEIEDSEGNIHIEEDNDKNYELKFVKVPLFGNYDDYIGTDTNIYSYDSMVAGDDYWIGDKDHDTIESDIKNLDFTVLRSKYYSIEAVIDLSKRNFTLIYFMNILMYNKIDKSALKVNLPNISTVKRFELVDVILTLYSLSYIYYGVEDTIIDTRAKAAEILGFNMEADLAKIAAWLDKNHNGLTLKNLSVDTFKVPDNNRILTFKELENIFLTNKDVHDHVASVLVDPPSKEIYDVYKYIYKSLLITNRNMEYFLIGDNEVVDRYKLLGFGSKFINIPKIEDYTNPDDYTRDYNWLLESLDYETLYFVMRSDFNNSHEFDLYIKSGDYELENVGTAMMAYTYREYLRYKDLSLYSFLQDIVNINHPENREEACINAIQSIISYLKDYISQDKIDIDDAFSGLPSISLDFIKSYVSEVIEFFSSFKIFTHGSSIIYLIQDKFENYVQLIDRVILKYLFDKSELVRIEDYLGGKIENSGGILINKGNGIGAELSHGEKFKIIDKVWFNITAWLQKNYTEYYNSDNYRELSERIKDYIERYCTYTLNTNSFDENYIQEIEDYAVDAILHMLVDMVKDDEFTITDAISNKNNTHEFNVYYNEWISDLKSIMRVSINGSDSMMYQDDCVISNFYN